MNATPPTLDLDALMQRIREEVETRKRTAGGTVSNVSAVPSPEPAGGHLQTRRYRARELLSLPDAEFIRTAWVEIFGHQPAPEEFVKQRDRLLTGKITRAHMLWGILSHKDVMSEVEVGGLRRQIVWDWIERSPPAKFVGFLSKELRNIYLLPRRFRQLFVRVEMLERKAMETGSLAEDHTGQLAALEKTVSATRSHFAGRADAMDKERYAIAARVNATKIETQLALSAHIDSINARADAMDQASYALSARTDLIESENEKRLRELRAVLTEHWRTIADQKLRMEALLREAQSQLDSGDRSLPIQRLLSDGDHQLDAFYVSFEDRYRGTRTEIKERQSAYLPLLTTCLAATGAGSIIDIGCGRGEWLELLAESGIHAYGFDLNRIAVGECRERGLDARLGDALRALTGTPKDDVCAITSFHVIEHLPFETLVTLIDESLRVLRPGGMLLFETPNPANLLVAAERFYLDPTHRNPLPSELVSHLLGSRGFERVEVLPLHPVDWATGRDYDDPMLSLLQNKLFGPQDYGIVGWKPA